jgi:O-succinylbenzoate synthase
VTISLASLLETAQVVTLPLRQKFRGVSHREILLFEGENGWAEWSPFLEYEPEEAAVWLRAAVEWAFGDLPQPQREYVAVNATLPAVAPQLVAGALEPFGDFETVKVKVAEPGQDLNADLERIWQVRRLHPNAKLRLDANGGWSVGQAVAIAGEMVKNVVPLDYLEQPCASIGELAELRVILKRNGLQVKIAADESVRKVSDPQAVVMEGAADILVLKAAPLGGVSRALQIAAESGLPCAVSSALESSVGLAMGLHLAACLPDFGLAAGLGTAALLAADVSENPLLPVDGELVVRRVNPSPRLLAEHAASPERRDWWLRRLAAAHALL